MTQSSGPKFPGVCFRSSGTKLGIVASRNVRPGTSTATYKTLERPRGRWPVASLLRTWFTACHAGVRYGSDRLRGLIAPQPEPPLRIRIERSPDRESVAVLGELDIYTAPSLE